MKAKSLMIGDWVCYDGDISIITDLSNDENGEYPPIQVYNEEYGVSGTYRVEPIPLTEEILKLNAFTKPNIWVFTPYNQMSWQRVSEYGIDSYIQFHTKSSTREIQTRVRYVHELQHLFRMCYENELADNFKVE